MATSGFPATRWTLILSSRTHGTRRKAALEELLRDYWKPLYVFARSRGLDAADAADVVQGLFADLLERDFLADLDPARGRLRSFLRTALVHHLSNSRTAARAARRGGGVVPIDLSDVEPVAPGDDPERAMYRSWARAVLARAMATLGKEYEDRVRGGPFELVEQFFGDAAPSYEEASRTYGMTIPQLKSFLHRARVRFRELVRAEVSHTVESQHDIEEEIAILMRALAVD
jgi:DNA-directed RNA polymerase specialized sigma24 family protein